MFPRVLLLAFALAPQAALAAPAPIQAVHPWIRAAPAGSLTAAGYVTLVNRGAAADQLVGGSTPAARSISAHRTVMSKGMMRMSAVASLEVPPGGSVAFTPGGYHLMLVGLSGPLTVGQSVPVTLNFQHAGPVKVQFMVEQPGAPMAMPAARTRP